MNLVFFFAMLISDLPNQGKPMQAGIGIIIATVVITAVTAVAFTALQQKQGNQDPMAPGSLDDFNITQAKEGMVIPWTIGRVRMPGNITHYGNLKTEEIRQKVQGGKGGGRKKKSQVTGYKYFLDVQQGIAIGVIALVKFFVSEKEEQPVATNQVFNDGQNGLLPTFIPNASITPGVAHISWQQLFLGENVNNVPIIHFVFDRVFDTSIANSNMSSGTNPAAAIYWMMRESGVLASQFNLTAFNAAASYYLSRGYGLNAKFTSKGKFDGAIKKILNWVDGVLYQDLDGKWVLKAIDPNDPIVATLTEDDMENFTLNRKTYRQVPNKFRASYIDELQAFTERVVTAENPAAIRLAGREIHANLDFRCFRDATTAASRISEVMKRESYPGLTVKFETSLKYSTLRPGDPIEISYAPYGIVSAQFRIMKITRPEPKSNKVVFSAKQMVEKLHDNEFLLQVAPEWTPVNPFPVALQKIRIFEMPYNEKTEFEPAFVMLPSREGSFETGYEVWISDQSDQNFELLGDFTTYAQAGNLATGYSANTFQIDDQVGLTFTPHNNSTSFDTISREQLFTVQRYAVVDDEIMAFQQVQPQGNGDIKLLGVRRGVLGSPIQSHSNGAEIYLAFLADNLIQNIRMQDFYIRIVPRYQDNVFDLGSVASIFVQTQYKARQPRIPARIVATRTGSNIAIQIYPSTPGVKGAGESFQSETDQAPPFPFNGDFQVEYDSQTFVFGTDGFNVTRAGAVNITIKHRLNNYVSGGLVIAVGSADGTYKA